MKRKIKLIFILVLLLILFTFCGNKQKTEKERTDILYSYKTEYVGDASKVIDIVYSLEYGKETKPNGIEIESKQETYGLKIYLEGKESIDEEKLFKNSVVIFSLIGNLSEIKYMKKENGEKIKEFDKEEVRKVLLEKENKNLDEIGKSKENLEKYLGE